MKMIKEEAISKRKKLQKMIKKKPPSLPQYEYGIENENDKDER